MFGGQFERKKVWLSGHTGFKGSWLATWLLRLGAQVHGFALEPPTVPSAFEQLGLASRLEHELADIRDLELLRKSIRRAKPDFVFHLAAQPLVRLSYQEPVITYETNAMGTVHVLEALRDVTQPCVAIFVTTDKCYHNLEKDHAYREEDPLGGRDPYSSSKAAAELIIEAYRSSFFGAGSAGAVKIASARAGNVIGGGDWASDRIVPDAIRALERGQPIPVRNKDATRPWQHVLEPLSGYLWLAAVLANPELRTDRSGAELTSAFNFGPRREANRPVKDLVEEVLKHWPGTWVDRHEPGALHEARLLNLDTSKARTLLGWEPVWSFEQSIAATVEWYRKSATRANALQLIEDQIQNYSACAREVSMAWAADHE
jgi:CDP-glucose 4,6-dehydratase